MAIRVIKRKSGRRYKVQIRDATGKQISRTFRLRTDAEKWEREQLFIRDQIAPGQEPQEFTFRELVDL